MLLVPTDAPFNFQVDPGGLSLQMNGVPVVTGSWFQYYEPGWTKGYYSSQGSPQVISRPDPQTVNVSFKSSNGLAHGTVAYRQAGDTLTVHYELHWDGDHPVNIELEAGMLWAPGLERGSLTADGKATRALDSYLYTSGDIGPRRFSDDAKQYQFVAPAGKVGVTSSLPLTLFDARGGYPQTWAEGRSIWWYGAPSIAVDKNNPAVLDVVWKAEPASLPAASAQSVALQAAADPAALLPNTERPKLIPSPKVNRLDWDHPADITNGFSFPVGMFDHYQDFANALARRFQVPKPNPRGPQEPIVGGYSKMGMVPGGYLITIDKQGVSVLGEEDDGVLIGMLKLASLAFLKNGRLYLPTGQIEDQPFSNWRGVHLFGGPKALEFQKRLWVNVLRPLGFNKVVLQCERTAWDSLPGTSTADTMSKADLEKLFAFYRSLGVEPIPLVESYGHMEWLFQNGKNLDAAMNPSEPYAVDPRKPQAVELLTKLWDEVIGTLHPETVHFGLDEVSMVGVTPNPSLETQLWKTQLDLLGGIAKSHGVKMMLWGDECLAPGEAPDATNGDTTQEAAVRRAAIPKGSLIGDWHYVSNSNSHAYTGNLQLWKDSGMQPIATTWYEPDNIRGFYSDASELKVGTLQTTWAGYESSEEGMLQAFPQFSAMVLAAEYGWSGREDPLSTLGYDPADVFREMYFGKPSSLSARSGTGFGSSPGFQIGRVHFAGGCDVALGSRALGQAVSLDQSASLKVHGKGLELALALEATLPSDQGDDVAELTISLANGSSIVKKLQYGVQVRSSGDRAGLPLAARDSEGRCCYLVELGGATVTGVSVRPLNVYSGLRVLGVELID